MTTRPDLTPPLLTKPRFLEEAGRHALQLAAFTEAELGKALKCNPRLAILNKLRYLSFFAPNDSGACRIVIQRPSLSPPPRQGIHRS